MAEFVPGSNEQSIHHAIADATWSYRAVQQQTAIEVDQRLGGQVNSALIIDDTGIKKEGKFSVGVARQWLGRLGKVDNGQVAVCAGLSNHKRISLVDFRLYLPEKWSEDSQRCKKAGVPEEHQTFNTKTQLALDIVRHCRTTGLRFSFIGFDGGYGKEPAFLRALDAMGEVFMADVHKDQAIFMDDPEPSISPWSGKGRKPSVYRSEARSMELQEWAAQQPESAWRKLELRKSTRGQLAVEVLHKRVWLWDRKEEKAHCWHLLVRREIGKPNEIKYSLSNAAEETSVLRLAQMQGQRFLIERAFEDAKSECGMADYQVRKWRAWHCHMTLVLMMLLFMLELRVKCRKTCPMLSCYDIRQILKCLTASGDITHTIKMMINRHKKRLSAEKSHAYRQQKRLEILENN